RPDRAGHQTGEPGAAGMTTTPSTTPQTDIVTGNTFDKYQTTNPIEQRMMRGFLDAFDAMLARTSPTRVLEVGVAEGEIMTRIRARFPEASIVGLDLPDPQFPPLWRERDLACAFGDAVALPYPDRSFDLVVAIEVLEHVPQPERALRELARVGTGSLIASVPF